MLNERLVTIFDSVNPMPYDGVSKVLNYLLTEGADNMQYTVRRGARRRPGQECALAER